MAFFGLFGKKKENVSPEEAKQSQEELAAGLEKTKSGLFSKLARAVAGRTTVDACLLYTSPSPRD